MTTPAEAWPYVAPEYATDASSTFWLTQAATEVDSTRWGSKYARGVANLAAHLLAMSKKGAAGPGGSVTMEKLGDMQQQFATPIVTAVDAQYAETTYGREFLRLRKTLVNGPVVIDGT